MILSRRMEFTDEQTRRADLVISRLKQVVHTRLFKWRRDTEHLRNMNDIVSGRLLIMQRERKLQQKIENNT